MTKIMSDVGKTTKQLAQDAARKIAKEPFEVLKTAGRQVSGMEAGEPASQETSQTSEPQGPKPEERALSQKIKEKDTRLIQALETEIKEIREKKERQEEEERIQVAQDAQKEEQPKTLVEPATKKGRKLFGFGQKGQAEKLQTRVEKPIPPSG